MSALELEMVQVRRSDRVAWLVMNRPEALNAWTKQLGREMLEALHSVDGDPEVRAIVVTGAGRAFSSGADLKAGHELSSNGRPDVLTPSARGLQPADHACADDRQARDRGCQRACGRDRVFVRACLLT